MLLNQPEESNHILQAQFCFPSLYDWFKKLGHFLDQSEVKQKPIMTIARTRFLTLN